MAVPAQPLHLPLWVSMAGPGHTADPSAPTHQYILGGRCDMPAINPPGSRSPKESLKVVTTTATVQVGESADT